jgi:hypothetical protein
MPIQINGVIFFSLWAQIVAQIPTPLFGNGKEQLQIIPQVSRYKTTKFQISKFKFNSSI